MKQILLLFLLLAATVAAKPQKAWKLEPDELVQEIMDRFDKMANFTHSFKKLKPIKENSEEFLKLAAPFGQLLKESLNIVGEKGSKRYNALEKLYKHMSYQFDKLKEEISYEFHSECMYEEVEKFSAIITDDLNDLMDKLLWIMDPAKSKTDNIVRDLVDHCSGKNGVLEMTEYVKNIVMTNCDLDNTYVFLGISRIFNKLGKKFNIRKLSDDEIELRQSILEILHTIPTAQAIEHLEHIDTKVNECSSFPEAVREIYEAVLPMKSDRTMCLTDAVFRGSKFNRRDIKLYQSLIQIELSRLLISTNVCGQFMYPNDTPSLTKFVDSVGDSVLKVSSFLTSYIPKKLNMTANGVEEQVVTKIVKEFAGGEGDISHAAYNGLGTEIQEALAHMGPATIKHQVLIAPSEIAETDYIAYYDCPNYWCSTILNQRGVDVMISRFDSDKISRASDLEKRMENLKPKIEDELKQDYFISLQLLVSELKNVKNITLTTDWSKSAAIIRHKTFFTGACTYPTVDMVYIEEGTNQTASVNFKHGNGADKGYFDDNTCHQFFFFL